MSLLIAFCACSKSNPEKGIIGKWEWVKDEYYTNGQLTKTKLSEDTYVLTFASNGNYVIEGRGYIQDSGTFTVSDTYLTMVSTEYGGPYTEILRIQSLKNREMILVDLSGSEELWSYFSKIH